MTTLMKIKAKTFAYALTIELVITILLCYVLAVALHHRPAWLPTISQCGDHPPEKYFFRWGILVGSLLPVVQAVTLYTAGRVSKLVFYLGFIGGLCLSGVAVVGDNENNTIHSS